MKNQIEKIVGIAGKISRGTNVYDRFPVYHHADSPEVMDPEG